MLHIRYQINFICCAKALCNLACAEQARLRVAKEGGMHALMMISMVGPGIVTQLSLLTHTTPILLVLLHFIPTYTCYIYLSIISTSSMYHTARAFKTYHHDCMKHIHTFFTHNTMWHVIKQILKRVQGIKWNFKFEWRNNIASGKKCWFWQILLFHNKFIGAECGPTNQTAVHYRTHQSARRNHGGLHAGRGMFVSPIWLYLHLMYIRIQCVVIHRRERN